MNFLLKHTKDFRVYQDEDTEYIEEVPEVVDQDEQESKYGNFKLFSRFLVHKKIFNCRSGPPSPASAMTRLSLKTTSEKSVSSKYSEPKFPPGVKLLRPHEYVSQYEDRGFLRPAESIASFASEDFDRFPFTSSTPIPSRSSSPVSFESQPESRAEEFFDFFARQNNLEAQSVNSKTLEGCAAVHEDDSDDPNLVLFKNTPEIVHAVNPFKDPSMPPLVRVTYDSLFEIPCWQSDGIDSNKSKKSQTSALQPTMIDNADSSPDGSIVTVYRKLSTSAREKILSKNETNLSFFDCTDHNFSEYSQLDPNESNKSIKSASASDDLLDSDDLSDSELSIHEIVPPIPLDELESSSESSSSSLHDLDQSEVDNTEFDPNELNDCEDFNGEQFDMFPDYHKSPREIIDSMAIDDDFFLLPFDDVIQDPEATLAPQENVTGEIAIYLSEIYSPIQFWFQCGESKDLGELESKLMEDYEKLSERQLAISEGNIRPGLLVACYLKEFKSWNRAVVINPVNHEGTGLRFHSFSSHFIFKFLSLARLFCLDFGTVGNVHQRNIKLLYRSYLSIPRLSFRGRLRNLKPPDGQRFWTEEQIEKIQIKIANKKLKAKVVEFSEADRTYELDISLRSKSKSTPQGISLRDWLIKKKLAESFELTPNSIYPLCYSFPTIEDLENNFPTFSEQWNMLSNQGIDFKVVMETQKMSIVDREALDKDEKLRSMILLDQFRLLKRVIFSSK